MCNLVLSVSNLSCRLSFLLSFRQTSRSQPPSHGVRSSASFASINLASSAICHTLPHIVRFVLLHLKKSLFQLGSFLSLNFNLLFNLNLVFSWLSRQPSILALLQCVDDFQYPCFSSSVQLLSSRRCSPRTFQPAVGYALDCLLLATLLTACCWLCSFASSHVFVTLFS